MPSGAAAASDSGIFAPTEMIDEKFKIFSGSADPPLADEICGHLRVARGKTVLGKFSDGEIYFQILENVRGADVFVVQPCTQPVDFHLMELLTDDRRVQARVSVANHSGGSVLLLRAAGPKG